MHCPNCENEILQPILTQQGIEVDACPHCHGVWLERGSITHFYKHSRQFLDKLAVDLTLARPGGKFSPRHFQTRMLQVFYDDQFKIEYCPASHGLWFDSADLNAFNDNNRFFSLKPLWASNKTTIAYTDTLVSNINNISNQDINESDSDAELPAPELLTLPGSTLRKLFSVLGYFAMLWIALYLILVSTGVLTMFAASLTSGVLAIKILLAPCLFKLLINRIYAVNWLKQGDIPGDQISALNLFIDKVSQRHNIKYPTIGVIEADSVNIFSFGYTRNHAHIVFTSGLRNALSDAELKSVISFEISKQVNRDIALVTQLQFLPFINRLLMDRCRKHKNIANDLLAYVHHVLDRILCWWQLTYLRNCILYADRFSASTTSAKIFSETIIKLNFQSVSITEQSEQSRQSYYLKSLGALGLLHVQQSVSLAVIAYHETSSRDHEVDPDRIAIALNWERTNRWSDWYAMWRSYPTLFSRMRYLQNYALANGTQPYLNLDNTVLENKWDTFFLQFLLYVSPYLLILIIPVYAYAFNMGAYDIPLIKIVAMIAMTGGIGFLLRIIVSYPEHKFPLLAISALVKNMNVSASQPIPCEVEGMLLGRSVPGYMQAEEIFIKDSTGIMIVDHTTKMTLANLPGLNTVYKLLHNKKKFGERVKITGWYRRVPLPYIEIKTIKFNNTSHATVIPYLKRGVFVGIIITGIFAFLFGYSIK